MSSSATRKHLPRVTAWALVALATTALTQARAAEFASAIDLGSLNGVTGFRLDGIDPDDKSGISVASAGDVNGDGLGDLIIGAFRADRPLEPNAGETYVVFGKASGFASAIDLASLDGSTGFRLDGTLNGDQSGISVASAGDLNGDGFGDLVIGAYQADPNGNSRAGQVYVVFGKASGFVSAIALSGLNGVSGFRLDGIDVSDYAGVSVASAGDMNGDGLGDIVIGAFRADPDGVTGTGESYVVFGRRSGFASVIDLATVNGAIGFRLDGAAPNDESGYSVASAGDVNGDGFGDLIIGASRANFGTFNDAGASYVIFGKAGSFASPVDLSSLDGSNGFKLSNIDPYDRSGRSVASAGDINGDGFSDLIAGAINADPNGDDYAGETHVVFGKSGGFAPNINLTSLNGGNGFRLDGIDANDGSGRSVASAGDMNGDGFGDIVVGAYRAGPGGDGFAGESYVVFGRGTGFNSALDLASLNGVTGFRLDGIDAGDLSGTSVAPAGDVNGDGFGDLVIGAYAAAPNGDAYAGESYVVFGRAPLTPVTRTGSGTGQYISGGFRADTLNGLGGNDTLEGRGSGDTLNGGLGIDTASYLHAPGAVRASLASPGGNTGHAAGDTYNSIENLTGSAFNDILLGNAGANVLTGAKGRDTMTGGGARDIFLVRRTSDSVVGALRDQIVDFQSGDAGTFVDRIDLRPIDARTNVPGDQAFTYIGTSPFSGISGQLRIRQAGAHAIISGDVNGDKAADFEIALLNFSDLVSVTAIDFLR